MLLTTCCQPTASGQQSTRCHISNRHPRPRVCLLGYAGAGGHASQVADNNANTVDTKRTGAGQLLKMPLHSEGAVVVADVCGPSTSAARTLENTVLNDSNGCVRHEKVAGAQTVGPHNQSVLGASAPRTTPPRPVLHILFFRKYSHYSGAWVSGPFATPRLWRFLLKVLLINLARSCHRRVCLTRHAGLFSSMATAGREKQQLPQILKVPRSACDASSQAGWPTTILTALLSLLFVHLFCRAPS